MIVKLKHPERAEALFAGEQDTMIHSCLQNVMGEIYADDPDHPKSAMAILGVFCFFAGEAKEELVVYKPETYLHSLVIMSAASPTWKALIKRCYGDRAKEAVRYAIKKEADIFSKAHLQSLVDVLDHAYELKLMDEAVFNWSRQQDWCRDWTSLYEDYEAYRKTGLGVVVTKEGIPVAGASSYSSYLGGIEIQVDTREEYRRQGLAASASALLILECLKRGWYPSWDAHNTKSVALAEKLGYHFDKEYKVFEVHDYGKTSGF